MRYNALTRRCFETALQAGELSGPGVQRGAAGSRAQGTWVQFDVRVGAAARIEAVRFLAHGCPHTIAVCAWLAEQAVGRPAQAALPESAAGLRERFEMPVEKLGRLLVVEDAWAAALAGWPVTAF